jgi:hypothetical protein
MKKIPLLIAVLVLGGCGKSIPVKDLADKGVFYGGETDTNVVIYRVSTILGAGEGARVTYDGKRIGYLYSGNRANLKLPKGRHTFIVDSPASMGECDLSFTVKDETPIYLEVKPQGVITGLFVRGIIGHEIASGIESNRNECLGGYQITALSESEAQDGLSGTKLTGFSD